MSSKLETKSKRVCCVINFKNDDEMDLIKDRLSRFAQRGFIYYAILHDKDFDDITMRKIVDENYTIIVCNCGCTRTYHLKGVSEVYNDGLYVILVFNTHSYRFEREHIVSILKNVVLKIC